MIYQLKGIGKYKFTNSNFAASNLHQCWILSCYVGCLVRFLFCIFFLIHIFPDRFITNKTTVNYMKVTFCTIQSLRTLRLRMINLFSKVRLAKEIKRKRFSAGFPVLQGHYNLANLRNRHSKSVFDEYKSKVCRPNSQCFITRVGNGQSVA